jgi:hypothetical protein
MRLNGQPLTLASYRAESRTNPQFAHLDFGDLDRVFLPTVLQGLSAEPPLQIQQFIEDDNRGAILPDPIVTLDGTEFYLSVKGVGSPVDPYSDGRLDRVRVAELSTDPRLTERLASAPRSEPDRFLTGELWLRGSPYGGQGLGHAETAMRVSQRADLTDLAGFRIAPVLKICQLPKAFEEPLRSIYWYRRYAGPMVQELRLVPSNIRIFFHARTTLGEDVRSIFPRFGVDSPAKARAFSVRFVRSAIAMLTLFARTLERAPREGWYRGLDFHDVWLDKDAVLAPDGTAYFVDLEGIEAIEIERDRVPEKIEDQVYRSLYECMFAFEQLESERRRRFGNLGSRRAEFESIVLEALVRDPIARPRLEDRQLIVEIQNPLGEGTLYTRFPLLDR